MTKGKEFLNDARSFSQDRWANPFWRGLIIFVIGVIVGWLVFGWLLFPVKYTQVYPNELRPEEINEYLLMTAESYAATGDLRTAAKRLRYWEPEQLAAMFNQLAQSVETTNPASAAYLRLLAQDLHLSSAGNAQPAPSQRNYGVAWLAALLLALAVVVGLILIAQKFGLLDQQEPDEDSGAAPPKEPVPETAPGPRPAAPLAITPVGEDARDEVEDIDFSDAAPFDDAEIEDVPPLFDIDEPPPEATPDIPPDDFSPTIPEPDEDLPASPGIAPSAPDDVTAVDDEDQPLAPQVLRFDGDPAYNTIIAIETNDDYLGEYGLSAGQTAPGNPNLAITLEVWLFDKSDTQTTDAALVPPVIVADPALRARYVREDMPVFPLEPGQIFLLETAELRLEGRVRRVQFGATTSDGVPVIEFAEIEMLGRMK